ncbi:MULTISPECIES: NAD(P)-dependent oxidoreductase [unclassified Novosphingobium]|uniref:NAD(P)-dependent oxidoreductase n=1 Tax=unclassified Novosphingobium TaxID=2644732 RepID=UPI000D2FC4C8|nr:MULTISPECIES: NAD(P)-dependent oxidoreductase [unclassified Novosphingobium]PTR09308.1 3-hydroxyisobutyrate dehydrogenase-like beta-hydroxyacid dehydrogenase [Novosphingobium sp. GV055]PUB02159.1 3-hydroxyisobutyrate dehydrogenase-like beta-hydroxyacid dehydrogenase [Novosphingobium sp. GV061]PUB18340.1 3-hydroxyisobutyrate dehydrogenase-like beta-hydroxyacid dehydrogenase [Novosphingobium sp. GV079]PUB40592.1 3-hydroxyisobutyrate dehydrogenase-like beta-hydroxyacid dehydrogenase [Novosphing
MERTLALIGFGEAGSTFAKAAGWESQASAFDIDPARHAAMEEAGVMAAVTADSALGGAGLVLSLVTADSALPVAQEHAAMLAPGALFCDMNSVAPDTKRAAALAVEAAGARYVDVAVLAPVNPARLKVPLLVSGPAAHDAAAALQEAGFTNVRVVGDDVGRASAIKMIRSIMVKGVEALTAEMMLAATRAGVVEEVLSSLDASEKGDSWFTRAAYNIERMTTHGLRRAAEMEESAKTLIGLGVEPLMTTGTVARQRSQAGHTIPFESTTPMAANTKEPAE